MSDLSKMFEADADEIVVTDSDLSEISRLAKRQLELEATVDAIQRQLETETKKLRDVAERLLPEAMLAIKMTEFKLDDGKKITIKNDVTASIRADFLPQAVEWLDDNGLGGIVKSNVVVNFDRGETEKAAELVSYCEQHHYSAAEKLSVNINILKATVKEQMANGVEFPDEYFSVHPLRKAKITIPKK